MTKHAKINLIIILALVLIASAIFVIVKHHKVANKKVQPILVKLGSPHEVFLPNRISATGNLAAIQKATLSAKVAGYVTQINYHEGNEVSQNHLLIALDDSQQKASVASARAENDLGRLRYRQASKMYHRKLEAYVSYYQAKINAEKDNAALKTSITQLNDTKIHAPFAGVVGAKTVSIGDYVQPGSPLVTLTNLKQLEVTYALPATYLDSIKRNQNVIISSPTIREQFSGKVSYISPAIDNQSQTISVHATIKNKDNLLKPGLFVNLTQILGKPSQVTVVPADAVFASLKGYYVFGIDKHHKAKQIPIKISQKLKNKVVILSGLKLNDHFITAGQSKVQAGVPVRLK